MLLLLCLIGRARKKRLTLGGEGWIPRFLCASLSKNMNMNDDNVRDLTVL